MVFAIDVDPVAVTDEDIGGAVWVKALQDELGGHTGAAPALAAASLVSTLARHGGEGESCDKAGNEINIRVNMSVESGYQAA